MRVNARGHVGPSILSNRMFFKARAWCLLGESLVGNGDTVIETVYITGLKPHEAQQLKEMKQASGKTWKGWLLGLRGELNRLYDRVAILKEHLEFKDREIKELQRRVQRLQSKSNEGKGGTK